MKAWNGTCGTGHFGFNQNPRKVIILPKVCKNVVQEQSSFQNSLSIYLSLYSPITFIYTLINISFTNKYTNLYQLNDYQYIITKKIHTGTLPQLLVSQKWFYALTSVIIATVYCDYYC